MSKYVSFKSSHRSNVDTEILVTTNYLILIDELELEILPLTSLTEVESILTLDIRNKTIVLDTVTIEYDNRGEPYTSGVTFTANDVSVFLDKSAINYFITTVKQFTTKN